MFKWYLLPSNIFFPGWSRPSLVLWHCGTWSDTHKANFISNSLTESGCSDVSATPWYSIVQTQKQTTKSHVTLLIIKDTDICTYLWYFIKFFTGLYCCFCSVAINNIYLTTVSFLAAKVIHHRLCVCILKKSMHQGLTSVNSVFPISRNHNNHFLSFDHNTYIHACEWGKSCFMFKIETVPSSSSIWRRSQRTETRKSESRSHYKSCLTVVQTAMLLWLLPLEEMDLIGVFLWSDNAWNPYPEA